jgi:hypothetical protein
MKKLAFCLLAIAIMTSCSDEEDAIDKSQLTSGIWYYEFEPNSVYKSIKLVFKVGGTYSREYSFYSPVGIGTSVKEGTWTFADNNVIDLTDFGICVQPVGGPPCIPPDVDFKMLQLKKEFLEIEELINGEPSTFPSKTKYINIKL